MYNLTAYTSSKQGYCSIWTELTAGRAGNDIASAFIAILKNVVADHPNVTDIVCWSDSCVPQNRNSHISQAMLEFLSQSNIITSITMKYSISGHSCVQEVDNMHKQIEDAMRVAEFYSPISFLRVLLKVNRNQPYRVTQMQKEQFMDYQNSAKVLHFNVIPFSKVRQLQFSKADLHQIGFKLSHGDKEFQIENIGKKSHNRKKKDNLMPVQTVACATKVLQSRKQRSNKEISVAKKDDLTSMIKYMPLVDREYYKTINIKI